jgi:glycosyltransferase involved in cell wall biosynthesis
VSIWRSDAVILQGLTLKLGWPLLMVRKPAIAAHQVFESRDKRRIVQWLRARLSRCVKHVACSSAVASHIGCECTVIGNPYDDTIFRRAQGAHRTNELIFVGRLVREKGADVLLEALAILKHQALTPKLVVVGEGPLRMELEQKADVLGIRDQIEFTGSVIGKELAALLNEHKVLVVPSSWEEPFGIVALEGLACGCVVVGSSGGGLPEAMGSGGVSFPNRDVSKLASAIELGLKNYGVLRGQDDIQEHLARHSPAWVCQRYIDYFCST